MRILITGGCGRCGTALVEHLAGEHELTLFDRPGAEPNVDVSEYGAATRGGYEPGTEAYRRRVERSKAHWLSRRDFAHLVECCLRDESVEYDVFYGVSDNSRRWVDLEHARDIVGFEPRDSADEWDSAPDHTQD